MPKEVKNTTSVDEGDVPVRNENTVLVPGDDGWGVHDLLPVERVDVLEADDSKQRQQVDYPQDPGDPARGPKYVSVETGKVAQVVGEAENVEVKSDLDDEPAKSSKSSPDKG